ncbi:MAG: ATP-dependent helicase RecQ [Miltoncostaeaceae bacterium]|nr:ATP-dependent helicase RecQ [Miltoncostaeaceae bacterium]
MVEALLEGRDALALLPTGGGKSLIYQLTAQLLPGATLVVSPLLALMKDQVDAIERRGLPAAVIDSTQTPARAAAELDEVRAGRAKLLYVTPERLEDREFMAALAAVEVPLLVVDEAHCISEWGHDFRPAYLLIGPAAEEIGGGRARPAILALTATATPWVRSEIVERLGLREPLVVARGSDRPNLFLESIRVERETDERRVLERLLDGAEPGYPEGRRRELETAMSGSGIVYTATTRAACATAGWLRERGIAADCYHGQLPKRERVRVQAALMSGSLRGVAATNAIGLGIDKPDVAFVIHLDVPASLEEYYQEAGRAGRDGRVARCTLVFRPADLGRAAFLAGGGRLERDEVERVRAVLRSRGELTLRQLAEESGVGRGDVARLAELLGQEGLARMARGRIRLLAGDFEPDAVPLEAEERRRAYERSRLEMMRGYAESDGCRHRYILNYFGEEPEGGRCRMCDNDVRVGGEGMEEPLPEGNGAAAVGLRVGDRVRHASWGPGVVQRVAEGRLTVLFEEVGYKTLAASLAFERGILDRLD